MTKEEYEAEMNKLWTDCANKLCDILENKKMSFNWKDVCRQVMDNAIRNFKSRERYPRKRSGRK